MALRPVIAVIGSGDCDDVTKLRAEEVGRLLAERGAVTITGGLSGVMEGASKGALEAGGHVIGILPTRSVDDANPYVEFAIATGLGEARNAIIANTAEALIVVAGGYGTLSEIAFALRQSKKVVSLGAWSSVEGVRSVATPEEAVAEALRT